MADAAVLVIDLRKGPFDAESAQLRRTKEIIVSAQAFGVRQLIVATNHHDCNTLDPEFGGNEKYL